jgi:hypothetical protein
MKRGTISFRKDDNYCIPSNSDLLTQCKKLSYREIYSNQNKLRRLLDLSFCFNI